MSFKKKSLPKNRIWIYGKHSIKSVLLKQKRQIFKILITKNNQKELEEFIQKNNLNLKKSDIFIVTNKEIEANFANQVIHQGFAILCSTLNFISEF